MAVFQIIQIVFWVITNLPTAIKMVREIAKLLGFVKDKQVKAAMLTDFTVGVKEAHEKNDFKRLNRLLNNLRRCRSECEAK